MVDPLEQFRPKDRTLRRSIIDRLIDDEPDVTHDALVSVAEQIREMREVIRRDLEVLLNTRRPPVNPPAGCDELYDAIVSFGVDGILSPISRPTSPRRNSPARWNGGSLSSRPGCMTCMSRS